MSAETEGPKAKPLKRRTFSEAFKRKAVAEMARTSTSNVLRRYKLHSAARNWPKQFGVPPKAESPKPRANGAAKAQLGPTKEAIVYLKHAEKAFAEGKERRGRLLSGLALSTLLGE